MVIQGEFLKMFPIRKLRQGSDPIENAFKHSSIAVSRSGGEGIIDPLRTITGKALVKIYNVSPATISKWVSRGEFPKPLKGGNYIWSVDAIKLYWLTSSIPKTYTNYDLGKELIWREFEKYAP